MSARGRACEKCDFFEALEHEELKDRGLCRKAHPERQWAYRRDMIMVAIAHISWPLVGREDWCGEFEPAVQEEPKLI
jgi:hypothetical protein